MKFLKQLAYAIVAAYHETLGRWGRGEYMTLDCLDGNHQACSDCSCICHRFNDPSR